MRKITCGCGTTVRGETDEALLAVAEGHIAAEHPGLTGAAVRSDLLAMAEDDLPVPATAETI